MAQNVWTRATPVINTSWTASSRESTSWTSTIGASDILIDHSVPYVTMGTYSSVKAAVTSIVGTKYHLFDDKEFFYGTDKDFRFVYDSTANSLSVKNSGLSEIFGLTYSGVLKLSEQDALPVTEDTGQLAFASDNLFVTKNA